MNSYENILVEVPVQLAARAMAMSGYEWSLNSLQNAVTKALNNFTNSKAKKKTNEQY
jgi:hypothetical protein